MMTNFNLDINEVIQSIDGGVIDLSEKDENEEVLKEIGNLREKIAKGLESISILDDEVPVREQNFYNDFDRLDTEQRELFLKLENEFIINSHLYFEDENINYDITNNHLHTDMIDEENIGKLQSYIN